MIAHDDRRNFYRMMVNSEVSLFLASTDSHLTGSCINLSATGMAVEVAEAVETDQDVEVRMEAADQMVPALQAKAKIVRCTKLDGGSYQLGLEIVEMN